MARRLDMACCDLGSFLPPELFRALGEPNRASILALLATSARPWTVNEVTGCCPVSVSVVSRHLRTLREAGVLAAEKRGREVYYRVRYGALASTLRRLADALDSCCPESTPPEDERRTT